MGTKIQANAFFREYDSVIDLNGSTSNGMRYSDSFKSYDPEKVRQTILEHESIFRHQLQELHRLYRRQQELLNEVKRRQTNKDDVKEEKSQSSYLLPPVFPESAPLFAPTQDTRGLRSCEPQLSKSSIFSNGTFDLGVPADAYRNNMEKQLQERFSKLPVIDSSSGNRNHQASYDRDTKLSLGLRITKPTDGIPDSLTLSRGEVSANSRSNNFNPVTRDFFRSSMDGMNGASSHSILGLRNEKKEEHLCNDYADGRRFDKHSSVGDFCSSKSVAFPPSLSAEPRKVFLGCPLDMCTSVSQRRNKIFGVEISEGNDNPFNAASNMSSTLNQIVRPQQGNHRVVSFEPSSWIANSLVQNLEHGGINANDGKNVTKGPHQCSESDPTKYFKNLEDINSKPPDVLKKDSENSQKSQQMISQHHVQDGPKGGLPWFLRNSEVGGDLSKGKKSSYFMNLDSLQNCSQDFFKKAEIAEGAFQALKQKKDLSALIADQNAEGGTSEVINGTSAKRILGFPISDMLSFKNLNSEDNFSTFNCSGKVETDNLVLREGSNNYIADLRHHIDLNLSLDEDDALSAPSIPTAIVKIATTEIDLEAPAVIVSETDASPKEVHTIKMDMSPGKRKVSSEECDKIAAEAIIAISLSTEDASSGNSLKWFAEIISSQHTDEEESVPDGMDYFEFMTLKLEDTKEEHYHYEPFLFNNPSDDDETKATLSKRSRRGQSRRGRQRKDFQRDILPGLVTLSRLEVTEDFQTFEELLKGEGATWQLRLSQRSSVRNGRGRKRLGGPNNTSPKMKTVCSRAEQPVCQLEERSFTGWGKRTRRLPRQRCPNAILSFPVKC